MFVCRLEDVVNSKNKLQQNLKLKEEKITDLETQ